MSSQPSLPGCPHTQCVTLPASYAFSRGHVIFSGVGACVLSLSAAERGRAAAGAPAFPQPAAARSRRGGASQIAQRGPGGLAQLLSNGTASSRQQPQRHVSPPCTPAARRRRWGGRGEAPHLHAVRLTRSTLNPGAAAYVCMCVPGRGPASKGGSPAPGAAAGGCRFISARPTVACAKPTLPMRYPRQGVR